MNNWASRFWQIQKHQVSYNVAQGVQVGHFRVNHLKYIQCKTLKSWKIYLIKYIYINLLTIYTM